MNPEVNLEQLESILKLCQKYRIEELTLPDGTKITKKIHLGKALPRTKKQKNVSINQGDSNDVMFLASSAPKMTMETFNRFGLPHMPSLDNLTQYQTESDPEDNT